MKYIILLLAAVVVVQAQTNKGSANNFGAGLGIGAASVAVLCVLPQLIWISVYMIATWKAKKLKLRSVQMSINQNAQIAVAPHQGQIIAPPNQLPAQMPVFLPPTAQPVPSVLQQAPTNISHFNNNSVPYSSVSGPIASSETHLLRSNLTNNNVVLQSVPMNNNIMATNYQQTVARQQQLQNPAPPSTIQTAPQSILGPPAHETATTNIMISSNSVYIATAVSSANVRVPTHGTTASSTRPLSDAGSYVDIDGYTPMFPNH